jgi:transcriptional regulator with XRE-family HTH domain
MTNKEVATLLNLDHSTISKYRNGTRSPSFHVMFEIEKHLGWPIDQQITAKIDDVYVSYLEGHIARLANG